MADEPAIEVVNVSHVYPTGTRALDGVSLTVQQGQFIALIGQNGSGKTTLVRHLNGALRPTNPDGRVLVTTSAEGSLDTRHHRLHKISRYVGYCFQNPDRQLFNDSCFVELAFGLRNIGVVGQEGAKRIEETLRLVDLEGLEDENPIHLSRGERQRLAIAAAMVMRPPTLIVDEPTTGQDRAEGERILQVLRHYNIQGNTVIIVSHDMALVAQYADRVVAMHAGSVLADGAPSEIFREPEALKLTNITPPQVTVFGLRIGLPGLLTVADAADRVEAELRG